MIKKTNILICSVEWTPKKIFLKGRGNITKHFLTIIKYELKQQKEKCYHNNCKIVFSKVLVELYSSELYKILNKKGTILKKNNACLIIICI